MLDLRQLREISGEHAEALSLPVQSFGLGTRMFDFSKSKGVMGVVNLSPDSWYRESVCLSTDATVQRARLLVAQGADLVDIGAESTLAQARLRDASSQSSALTPVIQALRSEAILVSAETYDPDVAATCLKAGANVLNLTGTRDSERIYQLVADYDAAVIICYVQGNHVRDVDTLEFAGDPINVMETAFARQIESAVRCGVKRIFLDPGLGFYYRNLQDGIKRVRYQMQVLLTACRLRRLGWPICNALPHAFEFFTEEVRSAESFFAVLAALGGTDLFRTHEVPRIRAVLNTLAAY